MIFHVSFYLCNINRTSVLWCYLRHETGINHYSCYGIFGYIINTLRPRRNRRHFADDIFKCIFLNENVWIPIKILLKFIPKGRINNIPALVQIMAWRRPGDRPLSEPMIVNLPTHICVTRPQYVKTFPSFCRKRYTCKGKQNCWKRRYNKLDEINSIILLY